MAREIQQNEIIPGCGFHHVAVRTPNWDGSLKFWLEGMGFHKKVEWGQAPTRAALLDMGDGNYLEVFEREALQNTEVEAPIFHFCLRTNDVDASFARAVEAGATVVSEPSDPSVFAEKGMKVRIAFIKGPGGEVCEFFQCDEL
jgi:glyoxylase I family protein